MKLFYNQSNETVDIAEQQYEEYCTKFNNWLKITAQLFLGKNCVFTFTQLNFLKLFFFDIILQKYKEKK